MANSSLLSPTKPHFFQPLIPGFQTHLNIPEKFFSEHIVGKHEGRTVSLISDASKKTWKVKMEDHTLTNGWKEFVEAHDLQVGDFVVFRHEGDMLFHVTALGPSCCEIQYAQPHCREEDEKSNETETSSRSEKPVEENVKTVSDLNSFSLSVTDSNLSRDTVCVPINFAKRNGLNKERQEIVLMNEEGKSWESEVRSWGGCRLSIVRGWTSFCNANKLEVGDSSTFRLLLNTAETPVFKLCSRTKSDKRIQSAEGCIDGKTGGNRFVKLTLTPNSLHLGKQHLPVSFTRDNGLINPGMIVLMDKNRAKWPMKLNVDKSTGLMYIISGNGWKSFCAANEIGAGESLTLELIRGGVTPLLKFSSKMEQPPFEAEAQAHKRARVNGWSQETEPNVEMREKASEEGEPSRASASHKSSGIQEKLKHTQPCSVSNQVTNVKRSVVDALTSIRRFRVEFETIEKKLEDSLQEINNLERGEDNGNKTSSSSKPGATSVKGPQTSEKQSTLPLPTDYGHPKDLNLSNNIYTALRKLRSDLVKEFPDGDMKYHIFSDFTLYQISRRIPRTKEELLQILGQAKVREYGDRLLETIDSTVNEYYGTNKKDPISSISNDNTDSRKRVMMSK